MNDFNRHRCMFVTDDRHPEDLLRSGHIDAVLRKAEVQGMHPVAAIQMVTINPATYFGLTDRGKVRSVNEDQFLIASLHRRVHVH